ncbi:hypothetical protein PBY51_024178 [Eleginops maclovinus]|uniref:Uncharacterized protein n=1 Tax=Eleginops maclovinus TaxID=56733 RepID=A0AAN7XW05_ELEMC|nr:hypothetical protein PBY51_024178 [Eleginops maclovinus]
MICLNSWHRDPSCGEGGSVQPEDFVSDPGVEGQEERARPKDLLGSPQSSETKGDIVAQTDPSKKTSLPVPSAPASSALKLLASQN